MSLSRNGVVKLFCLLLLGFIANCCVSCHTPGQENTAVVNKQIKTADSLMITAYYPGALKYLRQLKTRYGNTSPIVSMYYYYMAENSTNNAAQMNLYADSALVIFKDDKVAARYPSLYFRSLMKKGQACITDKKYNLAMQYYYNARKVPVSDCEISELLSVMAGTYYNQKNYNMAAHSWLEATRLFDRCDDKKLPQKSFTFRQGTIDNAGVAYQHMGKLDSAAYCYNLDMAIIDSAEQHHLAGGNYLSGAKIVVYDNIGGLYLAQQKYAGAEKYLKWSISIKQQDVDGIRIPPNLKLVALYLRTNQLAKADSAIQCSRKLLDIYGKTNIGLEIEWNHLYAQYLLKTSQPEEAYQYQEKYIKLKNEHDSTSSTLFGLNIGREFGTIREQQTYAELKAHYQIRRMYTLAIAALGILLFVIVLMVYRNLRRSRRNQLTTHRRNLELQRTMAELERANKNYIRIMRVMAHDLRNPLGGMTGIASMLLAEEEEDFSEDARHMLQLIESTGMHTMEMINELLKTGLADEKETIERQELDLRSLLFDSVELLQFRAQEKQQQIIFEGDLSPIITRVNYEKMWRVFNNLIVNAIKFSYVDGIIRVSIQKEKKRIIIAVADNGIGIPEKDNDSVFEMFTQAKKPGTNGEQPFGLGLSISKRIIDMHKGRIWFESKEGEGTTFYIELPL